MIIWVCPKCEYRISKVQYYSVRFDFGCPRCKTPLAKFHQKEIESEGEGA